VGRERLQTWLRNREVRGAEAQAGAEVGAERRCTTVRWATVANVIQTLAKEVMAVNVGGIVVALLAVATTAIAVGLAGLAFASRRSSCGACTGSSVADDQRARGTRLRGHSRQILK
jgi:hypothetical protein